MKKYCLTLLVFFFLLYAVNAQEAGIETLKQAIEAKFWVKLDTIDLCKAIIFNGMVYNEAGIDAELRKYTRHQIRMTSLVDLSNTTIMHNNCSFMILLGTGYNLSREDKKRLLKAIRRNLNTHVPEPRIRDPLCGKCKQVIIDGNPVGIYEAKRIVNRLKAGDISYMASYESSDPAVYGQHAVNGLIEIYLTAEERKKEKKAIKKKGR